MFWLYTKPPFAKPLFEDWKEGRKLNEGMPVERIGETPRLITSSMRKVKEILERIFFLLIPKKMFCRENLPSRSSKRCFGFTQGLLSQSLFLRIGRKGEN
jgi:hypothetical protein